MIPAKKTGQHLTIKNFGEGRGKGSEAISVLRCLTILIPPVFIYILLISFRPGFAYPEEAGKEQTQQRKFLVHKNDCLSNVDSISIQHQAQKIGAPSDTIYLPK